MAHCGVRFKKQLERTTTALSLEITVLTASLQNNNCYFMQCISHYCSAVRMSVV